MSMTTSAGSGAPILRPEQVGPLLVQPVEDESVAVQASTSVHTDSHDYRIPMVLADPTAGWVAEGSEIPATDADLDEELVTPAKLAGLTIISRELSEDTNPEAAATVGAGLARDIARKLDAAFFGSKGADVVQPAGLEDLLGVSTVSGAFTNTDPFSEAVAAAEQVGATVSSFVTDPATALTLAKVKRATGSNEPLLGTDAMSPTRRTVLGLPLLVSPAVTVGTVWALPKARVFVVIRSDARIDVNPSVYFTSDRVAVRATMRVGFGFAHPAAVVKITAPA
ncbi:phage major capsid protein [Microlunatus sp. Y2014]|uniref:phage major capsid protein n=1 Tax=Microlunatus sp. Y2014 TaxID=3418488 RepID=UPI003DA73B80